MKPVILIGCFCFFMAISLSTANIECEKVLKDAGATESFAVMVAHGIHGMTLDDLKIFDPLATENNFVPTIDLDLRSDLAIIPYAKDTKPADSELRTEGMKVLDMVIAHMNDKHWDIVGFTPFERAAHIFHMHELWSHTKDEFDKIGKTIQIPNYNACVCALDVDENGVIKVMRFLAMAMREPGLVYGDPAFSRKNVSADQLQKRNITSIRYFKPEHVKGANAVNTEDLFLKGIVDSMPRLKDAKSWEYWKGKNYTIADHYNLALFLHCAIAKAHHGNV